MRADDLGDVADGDKSGAVGVVDDLLDGGDLDPGDDAVEDCLCAAADAALSLHHGAGATKACMDRIGDLFAVIGDDHD